MGSGADARRSAANARCAQLIAEELPHVRSEAVAEFAGEQPEEQEE